MDVRLQHRDEIDGLRAVAVIPVIMFHAGIPGFGGGFVGVDIFFVISGYLITRLIMAELQNGTFSLWGFYERRARRILPALFVVIAACIPFAWAFFIPSDLRDFAHSVIAAPLFSSNFLFWIEDGYFTKPSEIKPLLHTWSLAVEEQYYILFPLFLIVATRWRRYVMLCVLTALFVFSLTMAHLAATVFVSPNIVSGNFYLLPTRGWEILLGSFAAFFPARAAVKVGDGMLAQILTLTGVALILFAVVTFDNQTPFPSLYALMPAVGTLLLILFTRHGTIAQAILGNRIFVGIGLVSYSAYLWHYPLLAFAKYRSPEVLTTPTLLVIFAAVVMLSYASWRFVERPFRDRKFLTRSQFTMASIIAAAALLLSGGMLLLGAKQGVQIPAANIAWSQNLDAEKPDLIVYGDSHAKQYYPALDDRYGTVTMITEGACISLPGIINRYRGQDLKRTSCRNRLGQLQGLLDRKKLAPLLIAYDWSGRIIDIQTGRELGFVRSSQVRLAIINSLTELIERNAGNRKITIIGNSPGMSGGGPQLNQGYERCLAFAGADCPQKIARDRKGLADINIALRKLAMEYSNVEFVDPFDELCDAHHCFIVKDGHVLYSDYAHLSAHGTQEVVAAITDFTGR